MISWWKNLVVILALALTCWSCAGSSITSPLGGSKKSGDDDGDIDLDSKESLASKKALSEEKALAFIGEHCAGCHGKGEDLHSTWPIPAKGEITLESLETMDTMVTAYQAMINKITKAPAGHRPSAMPPAKIAGDDKDDLEGLLYWFQIAMPSVVQEAELIYGASDQFGSTISVNLNYKCETRASSKNYMFRLFNQALGRLPTSKETGTYLTSKNRDIPVEDDLKAELAELVVEGKLKKEFFDYGLLQFAQKVGGAGAIDTNVDFGITQQVAEDLKQEFYQLLLAHVEDKPYKDILTLNKVMVTSNTAGFYQGCQAPAVNSWGECTLDNQRSNYFGTMGFLRSTPSSFLSSNNNYSRGGEIHAILRGERLMAQTDGPEGEKADPIPDCLTTDDQRVMLNDLADPSAGAAPRGAIAVPREGKVCQGCHLQKYLAVASYVFRPFDENGIVYPATAISVADGNPYKDLVTMAIAPGLNNGDPEEGGLLPVDVPFLQGLLAESKTQCITNRSGKKVEQKVDNIGDLVDYMIGNGNILVHGLARYIPSAVSNLSLTNQEIITAVSQGQEEGEGKLLPIFRKYFESETFSCASDAE